MTVNDLFAENASVVDITDDEWAGGWAEITAGTNGIPTAQQFNFVLFMLSKFIKENSKKLSETTKTSDNALPSKEFTANNILQKLLDADGSGSLLDADLLDGHHGSWYTPLTRGWTVYTDSLSGSTHSFTGTDSPFGIVYLKSDLTSNQGIKVNSTTVSAYVGGNSFDSLPSGHYYAFYYDSSKKIIDFIGGGMDKYMPKAGGTFSGPVYFNGTSYYIDGGSAMFSEMTCDKSISAPKVYGSVYNNDYAEFFPRGEETEPGDIIALDPVGESERYIRAVRGQRVVGIHSDEYAHLIGGETPEHGADFIEWNLKKFIPVGMVGRCHVKVIGKVQKGQYIACSDIPGIGRAVSDFGPDVIGFAVESSDCDGLHKVMVKIGRC